MMSAEKVVLYRVVGHYYDNELAAKHKAKYYSQAANVSISEVDAIYVRELDQYFLIQNSVPVARVTKEYVFSQLSSDHRRAIEIG